ncbi:acyltransferase [Microvirga sp. W0021]|uniref:Acyltransferase n=1 Tax=Hohaiivirga grylli TaxID=3133970 RepID=A0ABV0BKA0_9HYPH
MSRIYSIQALRAIAAALVTFYHVHGLTVLGSGQYTVADSFILNFWFLEKFGGFGVDLFFVISGFVMTYITWECSRGAGSILPFLRDRITRIAPIYWIYTFVLYAYIKRFGVTIPIDELLYSLSFIPYKSQLDMSAPIIAAGWTLSYEMYFYILVSVGMLFARRTFIVGVGVFFLISLMMPSFWTPPSLIFGWVTSTIILEFYFGMLIAVAYLRYPAVLKKLGWYSLVLSVAILVLWAHHDISLDLRGFVWGIPAAGIVLWFLSYESSTGFLARKFWQSLGASSYSLYLTHMFLFPFFAYFPFIKWRIIDKIPMDLFVLCVGVMCIIAGHILHLLIERPVVSFFKLVLNGSQKQASRLITVTLKKLSPI